MLKLFTNITGVAGGTSAYAVPGGLLGVQISGTFDGATMELKASNAPSGGSGVAVVTATTDTYATITLPPGAMISASFTSGGGSTDLTCWVSGMGNN